MTEARGIVSVDDDRIRVTTWTFDGAAGTAHDVVNAADEPAVFVEIELKQ